MQIENETSASRNIEDRLVGVAVYSGNPYLVGSVTHDLTLTTPAANRITRIELISCEVFYGVVGAITPRAVFELIQGTSTLWTARFVIGYQGSWFISHDQPILLRPGLTTLWRIIQTAVSGGFNYNYHLTVNEYLLA